jgi:DNA-directed RNA polymerase subunit omega
MAERKIDDLMRMTDSKYRLSVVVAKRAMQLHAGINSVLSAEGRIGTRNRVTLAMREMATGKLQWGEDIDGVDEHKLQLLLDRERSKMLSEQQAANAQPLPDFPDE